MRIALAFGLGLCAWVGWPGDRLFAQSLPPECSTTGISGPLRVSSVNPRYFTNDCGKAVYLTGSHTWNNFPDMDDNYPPENQPFDWAGYLNFLDQYNHNFFRLWCWEGSNPDDAASYPRRIWAGPQPWLRTGPGNAFDGHLKFDLTQWNQAYFDRLRLRVSQAQARGKYASIMLFEGWELRYAAGKYSHPFNGPNNINGIDPGGDLTNINTLAVPAITALQEAYVRRVIDSVNDLDNVLYEIANEPGESSTAWQAHMIQFIRQYEGTKPKQHPVGMTYMGSANSVLFQSAADWVSPSVDDGYLSSPPASDGTKVVVNDTDHLGGSSVGDRSWVWKSFTRGLNTLFMDCYDLPNSITNGPIPNAIEIRRAMGNTLTFSKRMDLLHDVPNQNISSTGYALAGSAECLVYSPNASSFTVNLGSYSGTLQVEWFSPVNQQTTIAGNTTGGATRTFQPPFSGDAVLYLRDTSPTGVASNSPAPRAFRLHEPVPNPANPSTRIAYELPVATRVVIEVFDPSGRKVAELLNRMVPAGHGEVTWDGRGINGERVSSGVWFVRMSAGAQTLSRKVVFLN